MSMSIQNFKMGINLANQVAKETTRNASYYRSNCFLLLTETDKIYGEK